MIGALEAVIAGKHDAVETAVATLLAGGHLLIEDAPGVGKTLLAQAIARASGGTFRRIQGTPDLLPGDVTGTMLPSGRGQIDTMTFRPGPVFANVVVFDELNRSTPRTQSALLEAAEESTVTVDGVSHALPDPFMIVATQNPHDSIGTYPLGDGALDRFYTSITPGRPGPDDEMEVLIGRRGRAMLDAIEPVASREDLVQIRDTVARVDVTDAIGAYVVAILDAVRTHPHTSGHVSTRGGVALVAVARAFAAMRGRGFVTPDDVARAAVPVLAHRAAGPAASAVSGVDTVEQCLGAVDPPHR